MGYSGAIADDIRERCDKFSPWKGYITIYAFAIVLLLNFKRLSLRSIKLFRFTPLWAVNEFESGCLLVCCNGHTRGVDCANKLIYDPAEGMRVFNYAGASEKAMAKFLGINQTDTFVVLHVAQFIYPLARAH
jgi:hypothetical protein